MYKKSEVITSSIILFFIFIIMMILMLVKSEHDARCIRAYAPDQVQPYEPMEPELSELEKLVLEDYHNN